MKSLSIDDTSSGSAKDTVGHATTSTPTIALAKPNKVPYWRYPLEYILLVHRNPLYRLYIVSHFCQHIGDWFVRIASLLAIERLAPESATALSGVIIAKTIPQVMVSQIGGSLADVMDRRVLLIILDTTGAISTLGFLVAISQRNLHLFYVCTALRSSIHALYEPVTKAILPMLVPEAIELKRAMTLNGMVWSSMLVVGGVLAGGLSATMGVEACYGETRTRVIEKKCATNIGKQTERQ